MKEMDDYDANKFGEFGSEAEDFMIPDEEEEVSSLESKVSEPESKEKLPPEGQQFPRYQWSMMFGANRGEQIVIRANSFDEFVDARKRMEPVINAIKNRTSGEAKDSGQASPEGQAPTCGVHGTTMQWKTGVSKKTNKPYAFWACPTKNADGSFCKYRPEN